MDTRMDVEFEAIEERAARLHARAGESLPWRGISPRDQEPWLAKAELELCQEGLLPSHRHCRGDHSLFYAYEQWKEADGSE